MEQQEINMQEILYLLLSRIKLIILLTLIGLGAAYSYAKFVLPLQYTSSVSIYVLSSNERKEDDTATQADLNVAKSLASTYIVILNDDIVYDKISDMLLEKYGTAQMSNFFTIRKNDSGKEYISAAQIRNKITTTALNDTEVIQITAVTKDPQLSADIVQFIADYAKVLLTQVTHAGSVETIGSAKVPISPSGPNITKFAVIGALLGFVIAVAIIVIGKMLNNCINSAEEIKQRFDIPVLGEIPDLELNGKEASKYEY